MNRPVPDEVLLGLLQAQPAHGYDLVERFRSPDQLGRIWTMSTSQIYAVLKRLEQEDAITGQQISAEDAPARVVYTVTNTGYEQLETWLHEPQPSTSIHRIRVMFLSRLYIAHLLGMPGEKIIKNQKSVCENQRQILWDERQNVSSDIEKLTLDFVIRQLDSAISWLEQCPSILFIPKN